MRFFEVLGLFIVFGSILFLAYVTTRLVGARSKKVMHGKYINIVETTSLGMDKQLHLVRVDKEFVLIAVSGKNVEFLTKLKIEDFNFDAAEESNSEGFDFKNIFDRYVQLYRGKRDINGNNRNKEEKPILNTEVYSLKRNLDRLKSINDEAYIKDGKVGDDSTNEK